jgi:hypothetical protein
MTKQARESQPGQGCAKGGEEGQGHPPGRLLEGLADDALQDPGGRRQVDDRVCLSESFGGPAP